MARRLSKTNVGVLTHKTRNAQARVELYGESKTLTEAEVNQLRWAVALTEAQETYVGMRAEGRMPEEAIEQMDRMWAVTRSARGTRQAAELMERETELARLQAMGIFHMNDTQFRAFKDNILMQIARHPTPNAAASVKALEAIERQRDEEKFGTKEAVERTLKACEERLAELDALEVWAKQHVNDTVPTNDHLQAQANGGVAKLKTGEGSALPGDGQGSDGT